MTTPTDDEREALSEFLFTVYEHGSQPNALREADAILSFLAARRTVQGEPGERGGTIPLYGMLDVWMALYGTSHPEFDEFYAEHGYAETWARILASVRARRPVQGSGNSAQNSDDEREAAFKAVANARECTDGGCEEDRKIAEGFLAAGFRRPVQADYYDEGTLRKVYDALDIIGVRGIGAQEAVNAMQNAGILFRERRPVQGEPWDGSVPDDGDGPWTGVDPQGEPSDAQVDAFKAEWWAAKDEGDDGNKVRRGLRAAFQEGSNR